MPCFGCKKRKCREPDEDTTPVSNDQDTTHANAKDKERPASASQVCPMMQKNDQGNQQNNPHEQCINRQKACDDKVDELSAKMKCLKKERKERKEEMAKLKDEHLRTMEEQKIEHQRIVEKWQEKVSRQKIDIQELKDANNELLTRLSAMAGARLTDGNANIADLSDENRPTKLAEQYSEPYDNEWTDAFEVLTADKDISEQDACHTLLEALCAVYNACRKKANGDWENMRDAIKTLLGGKEPPSELMKPLKDQRKKMYGGHKKQLKRDLKETIQKLFPDKEKRHDERLKLFLNKSVELCWLMVIQDPSVYLDVTFCNRYGEKYEGTALKPYTRSGQYIDYIVWPPLYLNEGGNILCKGIAQCKSDVTNRILCDERPPTSEQQEITRAIKTETDEENKHDTETNITNVTERDRQEKVGAIDKSEFLSRANVTVANASVRKQDINFEPSTCQETTITHQEKKARDQHTEADHKFYLTADISIYSPGANFDTKSSHCNSSNIPTNAKASVNRKRKSAIATNPMEDDRNTRELDPKTTTAVGSSKSETIMEPPDPRFENNESPSIVRNTDKKSKQYRSAYSQTGRKKQNKDKQKLNIPVGKAT